MSFEKILWNIAGAEESILEKCSTDHKKFSAIGATILMTAFIALCAGTSAAWYFSQKGTEESGNFWWSLAFGCLWATLIFCIDRSLVITLKKDPTKAKQKFIVPLLSRAALAIVVAFMVSIPLELVIFEDYIAANEENFNANQIAILGKQLKSNSGEDVLTGRISSADSALHRLGRASEKLGKEVDNIQAQINRLEAEKKNPNSTEYKAAKNRLDNARRQYNDASAQYNAENRKKYPSSSLLNTYNSRKKAASTAIAAAKKDMGVAAQAWRNSKQAEIDKLIPQRDAKINEKSEKDKSYNTTLTGQQNDIARAQKAASEREVKEASKQDKLSRGNHFIQNFQILEYAVWQKDKDGNLTDKTQLMFLWLIRLLFFIIEILPTIVKIVSPIGSYERMVHAEEQSLLEYLESTEYDNQIKSIHRLALSTQSELQQEQHDQEVALKKELLDKIKQSQLEVATAAIEKWKEQELAKINTVSSTSSSEEDDDEDGSGVPV
ncbi:DUF4407 domain-containing protein [Bacteroides xylanisolvens]|uniref:DUF4407 domain-containing protein n=1 Tax=Bacteroides xylanisolvens TaxID=371601 RepID=UPI001BAA3193|nr:DUF4407 domain-containing protein [Bacteroides xylanisolvens]QUR44270.1 DUF4407 domain-containing protein [Bacteroides xylanisolvens]